MCRRFSPICMSIIQTTSIEDVAQHFHISHSYLGRIFKQHTRTTPVQMLQEIRLSHPCEFLENTQLSVQEIAYKTGYSDVTFLYASFIKNMGLHRYSTGNNILKTKKSLQESITCSDFYIIFPGLFLDCLPVVFL